MARNRLSSSTDLVKDGVRPSMGFRKETDVIEHLCNWLVATPLRVRFQTWTWFVPMVQVVHILCVGIVLMATLRVSVRLVGRRGASEVATELWLRVRPAVWAALLVLLLTGTALTITEPARELLNWAFRAKMILVITLVALLSSLPRLTAGQPAARAVGVLLIVLGAALITAGRWIAYV